MDYQRRIRLAKVLTDLIVNGTMAILPALFVLWVFDAPMWAAVSLVFVLYSTQEIIERTGQPVVIHIYDETAEGAEYDVRPMEVE